jgi:tetratricopeptide (TPR) repeat protein
MIAYGQNSKLRQNRAFGELESARRNGLCPCGSGKKLKRCCGEAAPAALKAATIGPLTKEAADLSAHLDLFRPSVMLPGTATEAGKELPATGAAALRLARQLLASGQEDAARAMFERAVVLEPRNGAAKRELGASLYRQSLGPLNNGQMQDAVGLLSRAAELAPGDPVIHLQLGVLLERMADREESAAAYRRAAATSSDPILRSRATAYAYWVEGRIELAEPPLREAIALAPGDCYVQLMLGNVLAHTGRFREAEPFLREAAQQAGSAPLAYHLLANTHRATEEDRPLLAGLTSHLRAPGLPAEERLLLHFARGKMLHDLGEHEAAIADYDAANAIRSSIFPLDREAFRDQVDRTIAAFPPGSLDVPDGSDDARPVFILGPPRSGSTLVEQMLSRHPAVASGGEIIFWTSHAPGLLHAHGAAHDMGAIAAIARRYRGLLDRVSTTAPRIIDKDPWNCNWLGYLRLAFPRAHFVHTRRAPLDTCLSIYTTFFGSRGTYFLGNRDDLVFWYKGYQRLMRHWHVVMPPGVMIDVNYEDVVADPERQARRLVEFCGLDWDDACLRPQEDKRQIGTASFWQARQPIYRTSLDRWRPYARWLGPLAELRTEEAGASLGAPPPADGCS